jgi:hypothetical protein
MWDGGVQKLRTGEEIGVKRESEENKEALTSLYFRCNAMYCIEVNGQDSMP